MKIKALNLVLASLLLFSWGWNQEVKTHFRNSSWGMSQEQVKKIEKNEFYQKLKNPATGLEQLIYKGPVGGLECLIAYYFAENQLVQGRYVFMEGHSNRNLYIDDFTEIKSSLKEKYGNPTEDDVVWRNDLYKDDFSDWGLAISIGHAVFEATWALPETEILLQCKGDNYDITHILNYRSEIEKHKELIKKAEKKAKKVIW